MSGTASNFVTFVDNIIPTISGLPSTATFTEDTKDEIDLSSVLFADADGDDLTVTLTAIGGGVRHPRRWRSRRRHRDPSFVYGRDSRG